MKAVSIDLGGTHATVALVEDRAILHSEEISLDRTNGFSAVLPLLAGSARNLAANAGLSRSDFGGCALSFCGLADSATGRVLSTNQKYDDAPGLDLPAWCQQELGLPFKIENDARMALLGECYAGAAFGSGDVVMITLGTGIGGAAMMNGKLVRGKHVQGGCLGGHLPAQFNGRRCTCGAIGCAEAEASGWALPLVAKEWPCFSSSALALEPEVNFKALFTLAEQGDSVAVAIRDRCLHVWASLSVGLIHAYDPEVIVFGGGVMRGGDVIIKFVQEYVSQNSWTPWGTVKVKAAELGNHAGLLGAIPLLTQQ